MAKFLDTMEITSAIQRIIKNAKEKVILISPYIDISPRYKLLIQERNEEHVPVIVVWGKKKNQFKFNDKTKDWMKSMDVKEIYHKELHAKCYLNESEAIITSMNLYEASEKNNEMGILLTKKDDYEAYEDLWKEVKRLIKEEEPKSLIVKKVSPMINAGFCIRCKTPIKLDPSHPYCRKDYELWSKYKDETYEENKGVCTICGKSNKSSMKKPSCLSCYNKNKSLFKIN